MLASLGYKQTLYHKNPPKLKILGLELTTHTGVVRKVDKRVQKTNKSSSPSPVQSSPVLGLVTAVPTIFIGKPTAVLTELPGTVYKT